eukprot:SAG22_NODE_1657_length_3885_cov_6.187005_2_plen_79_part_00
MMLSPLSSLFLPPQIRHDAVAAFLAFLPPQIKRSCIDPVLSFGHASEALGDVRPAELSSNRRWSSCRCTKPRWIAVSR